MSKRHNVFVSYHHANDEYYKNRFEALFHHYEKTIITKSVQLGDIESNLKTDTIRQIIRDKYLRDSSVTVVLIGAETWKRKHVDWEISSSIRKTMYNPRSGLIGLLLPSRADFNSSHFNGPTVPPRLVDNVKCGFAKIYNWSDDPLTVQNWIHEAFIRRNTVNPDISRPLYTNNRQTNQLRWQ